MDDLVTRIDGPHGSIAVVVDDPETEKIGSVVLAPAYGLTAENMFLPAYFLARNGFRVVRFDMRNHIGHSSGSMYEFHLSSVLEDLRVVTEWAGHAGLMAVSLSGRPAIRAAAERAPQWLVLVMPVVDVQYTIEVVTELPLFEMYHSDPIRPSLEVLGHEVGRQFIEDCERHAFVSAEDTARDFERVTAPSSVIYGRGDPWVRSSDVAKVASVRRRRKDDLRLQQVATSCHQIQRNPVIANRFMSTATRHAIALAGGDPKSVVIPSFAEVISRHQAVSVRRRGAADAAQERHAGDSGRGGPHDHVL